jgi:parvulin-like peptidyl-prolyl isomerase
MSGNKLIASVLAAFTILVSGCQGKQQQAPSTNNQNVLARVNGTPITATDVDFQEQKFHDNAPKVNRSLDDVINQELLFQQGLKLGLDKDPGYRAKLPELAAQPAEAKRIEMARRVFNTQIASRINVSFQDARDYYKRNEEQIRTELHLEMIKFGELQQAKEALNKIRGGTRFEEIARLVTGNTKVNKHEPWDLGFVKWENVPIDFVEKIYKLKPGEVSDILGSRQAGFQIVKLVDSRKGPKGSFEPLQASIMNRLRDLRLLEAYNLYVAQLRKDAKIDLI